MFIQPVDEKRLQRSSRAVVQEFPALDQDRVVGDLLRQCMFEDILDIGNPWLLIDEFGGLQNAKRGIKLVLSPIRNDPRQTQRELPADYRQSLQQFFFLWWQLVDA